MLSTPRDLGASPAWPRHHCPPSPHTPRLAHLPATGCGSPPPSCPTCGRQHRSGGPSESKCKGEAMPGVLPQCQSELGAGGGGWSPDPPPPPWPKLWAPSLSPRDHDDNGVRRSCSRSCSCSCSCGGRSPLCVPSCPPLHPAPRSRRSRSEGAVGLCRGGCERLCVVACAGDAPEVVCRCGQAPARAAPPE
ncbi:MAG: hypothetical protein WDW38_002452 [Sanguina aurantia]